MPRSRTKARLDTVLVDRGLVPSRERARALVLAGRVSVEGRTVSKAGAYVPLNAQVALAEPDHPYVGRGGVKLAHALDLFHLDVENRTALDIGASTGGFTDVLLRRGAAHVLALDVGHGQLDWRLRTDPRVTVLERVNARSLTPGQLPPDRHVFEIVTIDVAFISLRLILPAVPVLLAPRAHVIALVKPQFEAGRAEVGKGGVVRNGAVHARVLAEVEGAADRVGLKRVSIIESPIPGVEGNREFFLHLSNAPAT